MTDTIADGQPCANTNRELWREREGDYYANSIHVTEHGGIGIDVGGTVIVKPLAEWHALALTPNASVPADELVEQVARAAYTAHHHSGSTEDAYQEPNWGRATAERPSGFKTERAVWDAVARAAIAAMPPAGRVEELEQRLRALHEALTPSTETKAAYIGEFSFTIEEGEYGSRIILVPWTTIKEIMAAIIGRAALSGEGR